MEVEGSRGADGGMVGRAEKVAAGGTVSKGLEVAGAVAPSGRVAVGTVGTAEVSRVRGCGTEGGNQSRKIGRSRGLPSSEGDISREMGRSQGLLCSGSDKSRGIGRSRRLGREPGEEGGMAALGHRDGSSGGAPLSRQRGDACLLKPGAGGSGVAMQSGELCTEGSYQPFMLGGSQFNRVSIGSGPRDVVSGYPGAGESFLHIVEEDPLHREYPKWSPSVPGGTGVLRRR